MDRVTVVVTTKDREQLLREAVASVRCQTLSDVQIVVVDDASTNGTAGWLRQEAAAGNLEEILNPRTLERSASRNRGEGKARAPVILWLDDDDLLAPYALEALTRCLDDHPEAVAAVGARVTFDGKGNRLVIRHPGRQLMRSRLWRELLVGWVVPSGQALFQRANVRNVGGWAESLATPEDQAFWMQVSREGPVCFIPHVVLQQRAHEGQWRPADLSRVEAQIREHFVGQLNGSDRRLGERLIRAWRARVDAREAMAAGDQRAALTQTVKAGWLARELLFSSVIGSDLWRDMASASTRFFLPNKLLALVRDRRADRRAARATEVAPIVRISDRSAARDLPGDEPRPPPTVLR